MPTELGNADAAAEQYEASLHSFCGTAERPRLDLVLLGLGSDGHTASLFPGRPAMREQKSLVVGSKPGVLPPDVDRVTLTLPLLNAADHVVFLVSGADKKVTFGRVLVAARRGGDPDLPASLIGDGPTVSWFVTRDVVPLDERVARRTSGG